MPDKTICLYDSTNQPLTIKGIQVELYDASTKAFIDGKLSDDLNPSARPAKWGVVLNFPSGTTPVDIYISDPNYKYPGNTMTYLNGDLGDEVLMDLMALPPGQGGQSTSPPTSGSISKIVDWAKASVNWTEEQQSAVLSLIFNYARIVPLLPLLLLRKLDNKAYMEVTAETRAKVLTDALQQSKNFNTWGLPGVYLEEASNAMIEVGGGAVPALKRMLRETRPAPLFGSKEYMLAQHYKYRMCDYALFFLKRIEGDAEFKLPEASEGRDALLKQSEK